MKFNMSQAWSEATAMFSANREVLLVVAGIFFFLPSLLVSLMVPNIQAELMSDPEQVTQMMSALWASWGWLFGLVTLAQIVGYLAMLALLRDHARPTVGEALQAGLKGMLPAIGTYFLMILGVSLMMAVLIGAGFASGSTAVGAIATVLALVLFIYLLIKFSLSGPVIALEKVGNPIKVLVRSWQLTKGNSFRLFGFYALLFVCYLVIAMVIGIPVGMSALVLGTTAGALLNGVVSGAIGAVVTVIFVAILAAVHRQLSGPSAASVSETFE